MLFATTCACCGTHGPSPCGSCIDTFTPVGDIEAQGVDRCLALMAYDDASRALISDLKYRGVRSALPWLVTGLARLIAWTGHQPDAVTWIPAMGLNRRRRGYDQSELLARAVARSLGVTPVGLLVRGDRRGQTGQSRQHRLYGPSLAPTGVVAGTVAIVDDVLTTGASMGRAGHALAGAGATITLGVVVAHRR